MDNFELDCKLDDRKIEKNDDVYDNSCLPLNFCKKSIIDCDLFKKLLKISGLTPIKACSSIIYKVYSVFIFFLLSSIIVDFCVFNFSPNPFDIGVVIYYSFFIMFFIYARYCYDIREHYTLLIKNKILSDEEKGKVNTCLRTVTPVCFILLFIFWIIDTYFSFTDKNIFDVRSGRSGSYYQYLDVMSDSTYKKIYLPILRLSFLIVYIHIVCYIANICFVFKIHKYQLLNLIKVIGREDIEVKDIIKYYVCIKKKICFSEEKVGHLLNLGIACTLFRLPLDIIEIIYFKNYGLIITIFFNSCCFLIGIINAARLNDLNEKFIPKLYKNEHLYLDKNRVDYLITYFNNNKILFKVLGGEPTTCSMIKFTLIFLNIFISIVTGLISSEFK